MIVSRARSLPAWVRTRRALIGAAYAGLCAVVAWSAVLTKEARSAVALAEISPIQVENFGTPLPASKSIEQVVEFSADLAEESAPAVELKPVEAATRWDAATRWFNGRPVKPVKKMWMTVTGYSPDGRSCGDSADGITATLHSVNTNGHALVAADPRVLRYGSMLTVPGYDSDLIVPVLDCGGAIKGNRLDLLFPTHEQARQWGRKRIQVTVWGYADGKPAENPRKVR